MRLHYIQHESYEGIGNIENRAIAKNIAITGTKLYKNEKFPDTNNFDFLVVMGGPMNIYEENKYSWLKEEKKFIEKAINADKTVLGICLGAQLIADVLGSKVYKNKHKEIGWFPVEFTEEALKTTVFKGLPEKLDFLQWHGDTFDIPEGCINIGSSEACKNQGFIYKEKVIGLQFHPEVSPISLKKLAENCMDEIKDEKFIQTPEFMLSQKENFDKIEKFLYKFLNNLY